MLGDWQYQSKSRKTMESWRRVSEQTFEGEGWSYLLTTPDQHQKETLRIVAMSGEVFYLAKVATNSLPVAFKLIECASTRAVFVNNEHDFPNKLVYVLRDANALTVEVTDNTGMGFTLNYLRSTSH
ncbi:DUF6265 family protein [Alteromonas flava]|uniref:DUF6265 family protein n=1 Tax=Alteromonas flava TaxID=2048003 RepID=UPI0023E7C82F|nr:DUF6265 family protein [Alteromonas flava]